MITECTMALSLFCGTPYITVGAGYKVYETEINWYRLDRSGGRKTGNHPISARIEAGIDYGAVQLGVSHHSNWLQGWPVDSWSEYEKTELFVDYTWRFD